MREKIEAALEKIRPSLVADGGNIQLVDIENGTVTIRMTGACGSCPMATYTLKQGIEKALKKEVPEVKEVITV